MKDNKIPGFVEFCKMYENTSRSTLLVCDIQPDYIDHIKFDMEDFIEYVETFSDIKWLYNGPELGYGSLETLIAWLHSYGLSEETINKIDFFEKGYGYYRDSMEYCNSNDEVIDILKIMSKNNYDTSSELTEEDLKNFDDDTKENIIKYPFSNNADVQEFLSESNNYILVGGAFDECLAEVRIDLEVLGLAYKIKYEYTY